MTITQTATGITCGNHGFNAKVKHANIAAVRECSREVARSRRAFDAQTGSDDAAERADAIAGPADTLADLVGTAGIMDRLVRASNGGQNYRARAAALGARYRKSA